MTTVIILQLLYPDNNNGICKWKIKAKQNINGVVTNFTKKCYETELVLLQQARGKTSLKSHEDF